MELKGKKVVFLGDSITEGWGASSPDKAYPHLLQKKHQLKEAGNLGIGGSRIAIQKNPSYGCLRHDIYFGLRAHIIPKDADIIIVFGGTNDFGHGDAEFGTEDSTDDYTFIGALNNLMTLLKKNHPNAEIIFFTPLHRIYENISLNNSGKLLVDYVNAIIDAAKRHNIKLIDLFNEFELDPTDTSIVPDGLHPNDKGHEIMTEFLSKKLLEL